MMWRGSPSFAPSPGGAARRGRLLSRGDAGWERHGDAGAAVVRARGLDPPAVPDHDLAADVESQPHPAVAPTTPLVRPVERLEDVGQAFSGDALAVVAH